MRAEAAFVVQVGPRGAAGPPPVPEVDAVGLGFAPGGHERTTSHDGRVVLDVWWGTGRSSGCHRQGDVTTAVAGYAWRRGEPWPPPERWPALVSGQAERGELLGQYVAAQLDDGGTGWVAADPFGMRCLYRGPSGDPAGDTVVVGSRAALVAAALAGPGARPRRRPGPAAWLALLSYNAGDETGFEGVDVVPVGEHLQLRAGSPTWVRTNPFVVADDDPLRAEPVAVLADIVLDEVGEALRAALDLPAERHLIRLTGGKDSRTVLAAALHAGLADRFHFETVGPPDFVDVVIAEELARRYGLSHETRFLGTRPPEPFADRFRSFVEGTAGLVNGWELSAPPTSADDVVLTGVCGELLRALRAVPPDRHDEAGAAAFVVAPPPGRLGLLAPGTREALLADLVGRVAPAADRPRHPLDRLQEVYARSRMRFNRAGPRAELLGTLSLHPLHTPLAVRAALALDPVLRLDDVLTAAVVARADPALFSVEVTGGWSDAAHATAREAGAREPGPTVAARPPDPARPPEPVPKLMAEVHAVADDRRALLDDLFADPDNPAWEVLDRAVALDALDRYGSLHTQERRELFGAATAVAWLSGA
jgi:hypothetical protein